MTSWPAPTLRPTVTLVVPNYNHAVYLSESLGSIAAQTHSPDRVLIIDDASTDDSIAVISRFLADHPSWELIRHATNQGVVRGQNEAIAAVATDWIGFLGADDALHPTYLEKALPQAANFPDAGLICACCEIIGPSKGRMLRPMMLPAQSSMMLQPDDIGTILRDGDNYFSGTVSLYRRNALQALGGFDVSLGSFSDAFLARQMALTYGFYFIAEILGYWRIHGQNYSVITTTDPTALTAKLDEICALIARNKLFPPGYDVRFEHRTRFGSARTTLGADMPVPVKSARVANLLGGGPFETALLRFMLRFGRFGRIMALGFATLRMRPMSLKRLLSQMGTRRAIIAATPAYRVR